MARKRCRTCKYADCNCNTACVPETQMLGGCTPKVVNGIPIPVTEGTEFLVDENVELNCWGIVGGSSGCQPCCGGTFDGQCTEADLCRLGQGNPVPYGGLWNGQTNCGDNGTSRCLTCEPHGPALVNAPHPNACVPGTCCHRHPKCGCTPDVGSIWYDCGLGNVGSGIAGGTCSDCTVACCRSSGTCVMVKPADCIDDCETGGCTCTGVNCSTTRPCCGGVGVSGPGICRMRAPCECKSLGGVPAAGFTSCNDPADYCNPCTVSCCTPISTPFGNCRELTVEDCNKLCFLIGNELVCSRPISNKCCSQVNCDDLTDCCICDPSNPQSLSVCVRGVTRQYCDQVRGRAIADCNLPGPNHTFGDQCLTTCCYPETQPNGIITNKCIENITFEECHSVRNGVSHNCNPCARIESTGIGCGNACCNLDINENRICTIKSTADCLASGGEPQPYSSCRLPGCTGSDPQCQVCESACCCRNVITQQTRCIVTAPGKCQGISSGPSACQELGPEWEREGQVVRTRTCSPDTCGTGCCSCGRCVDIDAGACTHLGGTPLGVTCKNTECPPDIKPACADALSEPMIRGDALAIPINRGREKLIDVPIDGEPCQQYGGDIRFSNDGFGHAYFCNRWDRLRAEVGTRLSRCVVVIDQVSGLAFFKCPYRRECPDFN